MTSKGKFFLAVFLLAAGIIILSLINSQINNTTNAVNEGVAAQRNNINQEPSVEMARQVLFTSKEAINIVGATPVQNRISVLAEERKRDKSVASQSESPASAGTQQENIVAPSPTGITLNKEPTKEEKKKMGDKGIIIF